VIARCHIPQPDAALLKVGDKSTVQVPGLDEPVEGKVTIVSPALDPNSTTVEVWVQIKNAKRQLKPGPSVTVSMLSKTIPDALAIPVAALLTDEDKKTSVMQVTADNRAHKKIVKTGIRDEDQVQIVEGLQAGDRVVSPGAYGLPDNAKVEVQAPEKADDKDKADDKEKSGDKADDKSKPGEKDEK
jgi:HlyD family secretion protein